MSANRRFSAARTSRSISQGPTEPQWGSMDDLSDEAKPVEASSMDADSYMGLIDLTSEPDDGSVEQLDETELPRNRPGPAAFKRRNEEMMKRAREQQRGSKDGGNNTASSDSDGLSHPRSGPSHPRPGPSQPPSRKKPPGSRQPSNARPQSASLVDRSESDVRSPGSRRKTTSNTRSRMRTVDYGETSSDSDGGPNSRQQDRAQQRRDRHQSIPESFQSSNATAPPVTAPRMRNNQVQANGAPRYRPGSLIPSQVPFDQHPQTLANKADNPIFPGA